MSATGLKVFDSTIQTTNIWLDDIMKDLGWSDRHRAYHALRAVLHTLRDRLSVDEAAQLSAQLPLLVRGVFFEGWHPAHKPVKERRQDEFVAHVSESFALDTEADPEQITRSVLKALSKHVDVGEIDSLRRVLPPAVQELMS
ncbi:MAG: DUF2267 domain-containing protein [Rudaea sp.]